MPPAERRQKGEPPPQLRMTTFQGFSCAIEHDSSTANHSHHRAGSTRAGQPARNLTPPGPPPAPAHPRSRSQQRGNERGSVAGLRHSALQDRIPGLIRQSRAFSGNLRKTDSRSDPAAWCDGEPRGSAHLDMRVRRDGGRWGHPMMGGSQFLRIGMPRAVGEDGGTCRRGDVSSAWKPRWKLRLPTWSQPR